METLAVSAIRLELILRAVPLVLGVQRVFFVIHHHVPLILALEVVQNVYGEIIPFLVVDIVILQAIVKAVVVIIQIEILMTLPATVQDVVKHGI